MTPDNKTLADVQPGGRVRLGDQAERARFEAWNRENWPNLDLSRGPLGDYMQARVRSDWQLWQAALSAQPSPGGQDALGMIGANLRSIVRLCRPEDYSISRLDAANIHMEARHALQLLEAALAARQPVGENPAWRDELVREAYNRGLADGLNADRQPVGQEPVGTIRDRDGVFEIELSESAHDTDAGALDGRAVYLAARQPVGEPVAFDYPKFNAVGMGCVLEDRGVHFLIDAAQYGFDEALDQMKATIESIGPLYLAPPAQAVDLGRFRKLASWVANCAGHGINDSQRRMGEELLALIDSQAAGK